MIKLACFSTRTGISIRIFLGTIGSISCVSAPNAQTRPQYTRPHSTVDPTTNSMKAYQARLNLNSGTLMSVSRNTSLTETRLLLVNPM